MAPGFLHSPQLRVEVPESIFGFHYAVKSWGIETCGTFIATGEHGLVLLCRFLVLSCALIAAGQGLYREARVLVRNRFLSGFNGISSPVLRQRDLRRYQIPECVDGGDVTLLRKRVQYVSDLGGCLQLTGSCVRHSQEKVDDGRSVGRFTPCEIS